MNTITADIAERLLTRDVANMARRVQEGGTLSQSERAMLREIAERTRGPAVGEQVATSPESGGGSEGTPKTVGSLVELAKVLGVSRQTVHAWRKLRGSPPPAANGQHDVGLWRDFARIQGLRAPSTEGDLMTSLKARRLLAEVEDRELKLAIKRGEFVALSEVEQTWRQLTGHAKAVLLAKFENELPPILAGLDAHHIQIECRKAIDAVLAELLSPPSPPSSNG